MNPASHTVLVVDDVEANRELLARHLGHLGHQVLHAADGATALQVLSRHPVSLVLLDLMMPVMDGHEVLERIKADHRLRHIPVIIITAVEDLETAARCIQHGAEDYLPKPFNVVLLKARIRAALERLGVHEQQEQYREALRQNNTRLEERVQEQVQAISSAQLAAIFAMSKLAESKDPETGAHLERMREYCRVLSIQLGKTDRYRARIDDQFVQTIYAASPLHDVGKVGVPDPVLLKPGKLDPHEWAVMKTHTSIGAQTLRAVDRQHPGNLFVRMGIEIAESHHEKWDGGGYPNGLAGEAIPLPARILALGDVYDALTSRRCYKDAFSHAQSRDIILQGRGSHFDPDVVDAFLETEDEFIRIRTHYQDAENNDAELRYGTP